MILQCVFTCQNVFANLRVKLNIEVCTVFYIDNHFIHLKCALRKYVRLTFIPLLAFEVRYCLPNHCKLARCCCYCFSFLFEKQKTKI